MQLDSGWAVEGASEGQAPTDERGQHVNVVPCAAQGESTSAATAAAATTAAATSPHGAYAGCGCGAAPQPLLNTGFVYVRARDGAPATTLPQLLYNRTVAKILSRLARPPNHDEKGKVDPHAVWAQVCAFKRRNFKRRGFKRRALHLAIDCHWLQSAAIGCNRLPLAAIGRHWLQSAAVDCMADQRLSRLQSRDCH